MGVGKESRCNEGVSETEFKGRGETAKEGDDNDIFDERQRVNHMIRSSSVEETRASYKQFSYWLSPTLGVNIQFKQDAHVVLWR